MLLGKALKPLQHGKSFRIAIAQQASGETAIDEFILENKYLKVAKAAVKGWLSWLVLPLVLWLFMLRFSQSSYSS
jgi:hypothetical protein